MVTYNGEGSFRSSATASLAQSDRLVVVDNASSDDTVDLLTELEGLPGVTVIRNHRNIGLAGALNQGVRVALAEGFRFILTLDQDSIVLPGMMVELATAMENDRELGLVGPTTLVVVDGIVRTPPEASRQLIFTERLWSGGSLIRAEVFDRIGFFREDFFIDYVDYEFCERAKRSGYRLAVVTAGQLIQPRAELTSATIMGVHFHCNNYSATRRYYLTRNSLIFALSLRSIRELLKALGIMLSESAKIVAAESQKLAKLTATVRGAIDALRGRMGPLE